MNTILLPRVPQRRTESQGRILAIEPDAIRAAMLRQLMPSDMCELTVVKSAEAAVESIAGQIPDLVLTSTFLPPSDEAALTTHLRNMPAASHLQVITVPHFIDSNDASDRGPSKVLSFLTWRSGLARPACKPDTVREQIETYLEQARANRLMFAGRQVVPVVFDKTVTLDKQPDTRLVRATTDEVNTLANGGHPFKLGRAHANDRRRSRRQASGELPSLWAVKLPWGADVKIVDISTQGVLLETTSKITPGRTVDLRLLGQDTDLNVPARAIRSEVASVDAMGVRYRVAAAFSRDIELFGAPRQPASTTVMPTALGELLARVLSEVDYSSKSSAPRARFEQGLRKLVPVRDVQIRQTPVIPSGGSESIYFKVPVASGNQPVLQAIFEPDHQPSANEFRFLKAAASLAAVVLEFAPLAEDHSHSAHRVLVAGAMK
jgi:CheY-like chemotaxis protein